MHTLTRSRFGYFNITVIDAEGKPYTTQLYTGDPTLPVEWIANRVAGCGRGRRTSVRAAYLFDTRTARLREFAVRDGMLLERTTPDLHRAEAKNAAAQ